MNPRPARIVHVDVDAFFASVEQLLEPRLRGKPVLVGRGVVASASYEAKARGVRTAMTFRRALELCPEAVVVAGAYEHYARSAECIRAMLDRFAPAVEQAALDDFYLDCTGTERLYPDFPATLRGLQRGIERELGLSVSVGAASSKLVASVASRLERPRGFRIVPPGAEAEFLAPLAVEKLCGVGPVHAAALASRGIGTVGELRRLPVEALEAAFGCVLGRQLWERARGLDPRPVAAPAIPKSVSRETTIEGGTIDPEFLAGLVEYLVERIAATLRRYARQARALTLRLRYADAYAAARSARLAPPTNDEKSLLAAALEIFHALHARRVAIGWIGVSVANLAPDERQNELFDPRANRRSYLNRGIDRVRERFGWNAVFYGKGLELRRHYAAKPTGLVLSTPCLSR
jgi:DNA polymerase IV